MNKLFFDTETSGLAPAEDWRTHHELYPHIVSLSFIVCDENRNVTHRFSEIIKPEGWTIPQDSIDVHGITNEVAHEKGIFMQDAIVALLVAAKLCSAHIAHNVHFDTRIIKANCMRCNLEGFDEILAKEKRFDTMSKSMKHVGATRLNKNNKPVPKFPTLQELHVKLFDVQFGGAHNSMADTEAVMRCFYELQRIGIITP